MFGYKCQSGEIYVGDVETMVYSRKRLEGKPVESCVRRRADPRCFLRRINSRCHRAVLSLAAAALGEGGVELSLLELQPPPPPIRISPQSVSSPLPPSAAPLRRALRCLTHFSLLFALLLPRIVSQREERDGGHKNGNE